MTGVTLTDVAQRAGVSTPTASRVLRGVATVDQQLKEKVLLAASELGYQPNRLARSLRERRTGIIGFLNVGSTAKFHTVLAQGIYDAGLENGYAVVTGMSDTTDRQQSYAQIFAGFQVDGIIVVPTSQSDPAIDRIAKHIPVVEVDRSASSVSRHSVLLDNQHAMEMAVDHLVELGHRHIALLYGVEQVNTELERVEGYLCALRKHGLPRREALMLGDDFSEAGGMRSTAKLLDSGVPVTAVLTTTNEMLAGAVQVLREREINVPEQLSLIGMDDTRWVRLMTPPVTVVEQPAYDMGKKAMELLLAAIDEKAGQHPAEIRFAPRLIVRSSTSPPPFDSL
ncbi:LacI family DNA-binding transcriptional regulator [Deinococcus antarcticus]|uniref:LacI family DNA-binding transcriptional regulator n=1 Tax=Deinococcus antarcticus TaxID=1298767 RepID=A0ABV8A9I8_9DEIO